MFNKSNTIIYFAPHQDDELLTMGIDICDSLAKNKDVHVVLCTDGSGSSVRGTLNNGRKCAKHPGEHIYDLSVEQFIKARDDEFIASCKALGIKAENIHIPAQRGKDGSLSLSVAENIIKKYLSECSEDAIVCTISQNNGTKQHRDHKTLGKAAENLLNRGIIKQLKLFIEPYHFEQIKDNPRLIPVAPTVVKAKTAVTDRIREGIAAYSYWNPLQGRYAVGYHSVSNEFNDFVKEMTGRYFVKMNAKYMSIWDKLTWQHKKWQKLKKQKQLYYSLSKCKQPDLGDAILISVLAGECEQYKTFCEEYNISLTEKNLQRIKDGSSFWCLVNKDKEILTNGWLAYRHHFYISETDFDFDMADSDTGLLYNFNTKEEYRGRGLYGLLLKAIVANAKEPKEYIIYTSPDNQSSHKGILKAGFDYDGALSAEDNSLNRYLRKKGFKNIKRKYKLWGLSVAD